MKYFNQLTLMWSITFCLMTSIARLDTQTEGRLSGQLDLHDVTIQAEFRVLDRNGAKPGRNGH